MQTSFGLLAVFGALCVEHVQAQEQFPEYWCRGFNQTGYYNQAYNQAWGDDSTILSSQLSRRISDAVICNSTNVITTGDKNGTCAIEAGGYFTTLSFANVSAGSGLIGNPNGTYFYTEESVQYTVSTMIDIDDAELFRGGQEGGVRQARYHINEGTNAYVAFAPMFRCVSGWLSDCPREIDLNDTFVEVCRPAFTEGIIDVNDRKIPVYEGNSYIMMVNQTEAANLISMGFPLEQPRAISEAGLVKIGSLITLAGGMVMFFALA
ncbi:hypothetical protein D0869_07266 [Hortaea werneckii]|uniref:Uncharacterized protein n=1 Tax=Hortaea werneckii TaxID=91943 RepID=A0A3M6Y225_HORWE|nr:hypothetical protein KC324_g2878 [Hortaea werneckii]KAI7590266.1 hypothetical protein KC316_g3474 [Hortaea werneckii]RMX80829.1 hypothetical protein D0869_07266 [Hortaea werneckii]RMX97034.1 hypothetical protein D0868_10859 [Hortaea werneckii]